MRSPLPETILDVRCSSAVRPTSGPRTECGDFAESFALPDASVAIGVWDASTKGEATASNTLLVRAGLRAMLGVENDVVRAMEALNRVLYRESENGKPSAGVAGFFGVIDTVERTLRYVSCGNDAAVLFRATGEHVHLPDNSRSLGVDERCRFVQDSIGLAPGDALIVATDGVTKARPRDARAESFGTKRLCSLFGARRTERDADATWLIDQVVGYTRGRLDDAALLVARFT